MLRWLGSNAEAVIALAIAVVVGVAGFIDLASAKLVNSAVLITLAALSLALIRDHWGRERNEPEVRRTLDATQRALAELPARFERIERANIERANDVITDARAAIDEASMMRLMVGAEINRALSEAPRRTDLWMFKGGTGIFMRAVTVPECVNAARRDRLFQRSGHVGPSATIVLGEDDPAERNLILGSPDRVPTAERRELCPPVEVADAARMVLAVR